VSTEIDRRVAALNRAMTACGGGVETVGAPGPEGGVLRLRLVGMCAGCSCRAVTTASTLRPSLVGVDGVRDVSVQNSRISRHAAQRLAAAFAAVDSGCPAESPGEGAPP
jgi:Fe-S cluster biogenesis protein NfuA